MQIASSTKLGRRYTWKRVPGISSRPTLPFHLLRARPSVLGPRYSKVYSPPDPTPFGPMARISKNWISSLKSASQNRERSLNSRYEAELQGIDSKGLELVSFDSESLTVRLWKRKEEPGSGEAFIRELRAAFEKAIEEGRAKHVSEPSVPEGQILTERFHALVDRKLLGQITPPESEELARVRLRLRELKAPRHSPSTSAAEGLRKDHQDLLKAIEEVRGTLKVIRERTAKAS